MMRACFSRAACASRDIASCSALGMTTSRISTDCTVMPHGFERTSISCCSSVSIRSRPRSRSVSAVRPMMSRRAGLRRPAHGLLVVLHFERGLLRVVHHPEQHGVHVDRHRVRRQRLLGGEARRDGALIDPRRHRVDERHDPEEAGPLQADEFSEAQDDGAFPLLRDLRRLHGDHADDRHDDERNRVAHRERGQPSGNQRTEQHCGGNDVDVRNVRGIARSSVREATVMLLCVDATPVRRPHRRW